MICEGPFPDSILSEWFKCPACISTIFLASDNYCNEKWISNPIWQVKPRCRSKLPPSFLFCLHYTVCIFVCSAWIALKPHKNNCKYANDLENRNRNIEPIARIVRGRIVKGDLISHFHIHIHTQCCRSGKPFLFCQGLKWPRNHLSLLSPHGSQNPSHLACMVVQRVKPLYGRRFMSGCSSSDPAFC